MAVTERIIDMTGENIGWKGEEDKGREEGGGRREGGRVRDCSSGLGARRAGKGTAWTYPAAHCDHAFVALSLRMTLCPMCWTY